MKNFFTLTALSVALITLAPSIGVADKTQSITPVQNAPASFADLAEKLLPSVVNVSSTQKVEMHDSMGALPEFPEFPEGSPFKDFFEEFMGRRFGSPLDNGSAAPAASLGSGFIIDADKGLIITNNHVIRDADEISITLHDDTTVPAEIIGRDEKVDIAVLKIETKTPLTAVTFGDSADMRVGDWIVAIGNPFGLGGTVTSGIISARHRDINSGPYDDYFQTDASINRGNSGGPMFNMAGEVIGINTAIFSPSGGSVGIGFAIKSNQAQPLVKQLVEHGRTRRGWLGVRIQTVTDEIAESLSLDEPRGALVAGVTDGGPAQRSKLKMGDIILTFDGKEVSTMRSLPRIVAETPIDKNVMVEYWRDGRKRKTRVKIGELEKAEDDGLLGGVADKNINDDEEAVQDLGQDIDPLGLSVTPLNDDIREEYNIDDNIDGVLIIDIDPKSRAAFEGIDIGDVIVEINQKQPDNAKDILDQIRKAKKLRRSSVLLLLNRAGNMRFVALALQDDD